MLNIFKKGHETLTTDIETWAVRWNRSYGIFMNDYEETAQFLQIKRKLKNSQILYGELRNY